MILKNKNGTQRIEFQNLVKLNNENPIFIQINVNITNDFFEASQQISVELSDLEELSNNLNSLCSNKARVCYFQHIDERLKIKFSNNNGEFSIEGFLKDQTYFNSVNFYFEVYPIDIIEFNNELRAELRLL